MAKDKRTDLPGADLLFGGHTNKDQDDKKVAEKTETPRGTETLAMKMAPVEETEPVKFTFYFSPKLLEELEVAKFRLRMEKRMKISKSDIVNAALTYALKDMNFLERLVSGKIE